MSPLSSSDAELSPRLAAAIARLETALDALDSAATERLESDRSLADFEEELAIMQDDRNSLAQDLDAALTRTASVEKMRDEILRRLERASGNVAAVLGHTPRFVQEE